MKKLLLVLASVLLLSSCYSIGSSSKANIKVDGVKFSVQSVSVAFNRLFFTSLGRYTSIDNTAISPFYKFTVSVTGAYHNPGTFELRSDSDVFRLKTRTVSVMTTTYGFSRNDAAGARVNTGSVSNSTTILETVGFNEEQFSQVVKLINNANTLELYFYKDETTNVITNNPTNGQARLLFKYKPKQLEALKTGMVNWLATAAPN